MAHSILCFCRCVGMAMISHTHLSRSQQNCRAISRSSKSCPAESCMQYGPPLQHAQCIALTLAVLAALRWQCEQHTSITAALHADVVFSAEMLAQKEACVCHRCLTRGQCAICSGLTLTTDVAGASHPEALAIHLARTSQSSSITPMGSVLYQENTSW